MRGNPAENRVRRAGRRVAQPRLLAAGGHFFCLRLYHQRADRHPHDRTCARITAWRRWRRAACWRSWGCSTWWAPPPSGWLTDRYDPKKVAVCLLRPARAVADLSALCRISAFTACRCLRCFTAWTGSPPCRPPWPSPTAPSAPKKRRCCSAGFRPVINWVPQRRHSFAGASRTATGSYLQSFVVAGFVAVGGGASVPDHEDRQACLWWR